MLISLSINFYGVKAFCICELVSQMEMLVDVSYVLFLKIARMRSAFFQR